jgi:hypothetical protein
MAGELKLNWPISDTLFACVFNSSGKIWHPTGQVFETLGTGSRTANDYALTMIGYSGGLQLGDMDTNIPAGNYIALYYLRSTGTPLDADMLDSVGKQDLYWTGSIVSTEIVSASPITKAEILSFVNSRLNRTETDIDESIKIVLGDLSAFKTLLVEDTSQSLTISDTYLSYPSDALMDDYSIKSVKLTDSSGYITEPLEVIKDGWREYLTLSQDGYRSVPLGYITNANRIYFWPWPDGTYAASIWYYKRHSEDPDDIDFDIDWKNTVYFGVTAEVAIHRKMYEQTTIWTNRYEREKQRIKLIKQ